MKNNKNKKKRNPLPANLIPLAKEHPKGKTWDELKAYNEQLRNTYAQIAPTPRNKSYIRRLDECSTFIEFQRGGDAWRLSKASFCHVRLCPVCQWRRSMVWQKRFINAYPEIQKAHPNARYIFLTLTIKNCEIHELKATLKSIGQGFKRMTMLKDWPAIGWARTFEVTRNEEDNTAHPHLHALLMVKPSYFQGSQYLSQATWSNVWQKAMRLDYTPIVHVQAVKPKHDSLTLNPIACAILEVFKYSIKPSDMVADPEFLDELTRQMKGVRAVGLGGIFKELIKETEEKLEELEGVEIENPETLRYNFYPVWKQYARKNNHNNKRSTK